MLITGVLLAAGTSSRMGSDNKLLLSLGNQTMIEMILGNLIRSQLDNIIVVTGYDSKIVNQTLSLLPDQQRFKIIENKLYAEGRASSIKCALSNSKNNCDALLFMVADKPTVSTNLINRTIALFKSEGPALLAVKTDEGRGHPVIFSKMIFAELEELQGDQVGQELLDNYADNVLWLSDSESQPNINTRQDYNNVMQSMGLDY